MDRERPSVRWEYNKPPRDIDDRIRRIIDDAVEAWHDSDDPRPLHEYLGMTWEEYKQYMSPGPSTYLDEF